MENLNSIRELFINRDDVYAEGYLSGERMAYIKKDKPITLQMIKEHLEATRTMGIYQLHGGNVKWGCFDFDENTAEDFEKAKVLYTWLKDKGYHPLMENSGGGNYKTHIWIFANSDAVSMKSFMEEMCNGCNVKPHEIFPKQTEIDSGEYGNLVKLPLALHLVSGKRSFFYDNNFEIEADYEKIIDYHIQNKDVIPKVIIKEKKIVIGSPVELDFNDCAFLNYCLAHELPKGKRHEVISRNMAWYVGHHPDGELIRKQYIEIQKGSEHELDGWIKGIEKGKGVPVACGELINYQREFKIPLKCRGCQKFREYLREKKTTEQLKEKIKDEVKEEEAKKEGFLLDSFNVFTDYLQIAKEFVKVQPVYYDSAKNWWVWNHIDRCYVLMDETDILNRIDQKTKAPTVKAQIKGEILEALKRVGRLAKPKDWNKHWIQFRNKIIDYRTEEEIEISPEYFSTNPIPWNIGEMEDTPIMDKIFEEWVEKDNVKTLYEFLAFCLVCDYPLHRIIALVGSGSNGKGTFMRLVEKFIGLKNICSSELEAIVKSRFESSRLYRKLVCMMGETNFEELGETSMLKKLTGQDLIGFEFKNKDLFNDYSYAKLIVATNSLPPTTDKTLGFYRRWLIIDFPNTFLKESDILSTIPEDEYEHLARKCIGILRELIERKSFLNDGTFEERAEKYEAKSNPLKKFVNEFTKEDIEGFVFCNDFYNKLKSWLIENRFRQISEETVCSQMKKMGYEKTRRYFNWMYDGRGGQAFIFSFLKWKNWE